MEVDLAEIVAEVTTAFDRGRRPKRRRHRAA